MPSPELALTSFHCMLIDDDQDDQDIFIMALKDVHPAINCTFANNGIHALDLLNSNANFIPDFIFIDMNMPRMTGIQCLKEIKLMDRLQAIPVYMYSTSSDPKEIQKSQEEGAAGFIIKPANLTSLTNTLSKLLMPKLSIE